MVCVEQGMTVERLGFTASHDNHLPWIRPQLITGHRFQNLTTR